MTGSFQIPAGVRIRKAAPSDMHRLAQVLPRGFRLPDTTRYFVAESERGELLGGAYMFLSPSLTGGRQAVFNQTLLRSEGLEPLNILLLRACLVQARSLGAESLSYDGMLPEVSEFGNFLTAQGFLPEKTLTGYEMDLADGSKVVRKVCALLARGKKIPADARVMPFTEAPQEASLNLLYRHFGLSPSLPEHNFLPEMSTVVLCGPRVAGVILAEEKMGGLYVPHTAVDQEFRQGWVTPMLWDRFSLFALEKGYATVGFATSEEQFRSMANFAKRLRSVPGNNLSCYRLNLS